MTIKSDETKEYCEENKENISASFLLPSIELNNNILSKFYENGFKNTYTFCNGINYPFPVLYIVFDSKREEMNFKFHKSISSNYNIVDEIDIGPGKVLYTFQIPEKYRENYTYFYEGKYSKFTNDYKKLFPLESVETVTTEFGRMVTLTYTEFYHVFNRTDEMRELWAKKLGYDKNDEIFDDIDYYSVPDLDRETLTLDNITYIYECNKNKI